MEENHSTSRGPAGQTTTYVLIPLGEADGVWEVSILGNNTARLTIYNHSQGLLRSCCMVRLSIFFHDSTIS